MTTALHDLRLDSITVIYPGKNEYRLHEKISVKPFAKLLEE